VECLPADKPWDVVSVTRRSFGVAPRACVRVYARVLVPPNLYIHTYINPDMAYIRVHPLPGGLHKCNSVWRSGICTSRPTGIVTTRSHLEREAFNPPVNPRNLNPLTGLRVNALGHSLFRWPVCRRCWLSSRSCRSSTTPTKPCSPHSSRDR